MRCTITGSGIIKAKVTCCSFPHRANCRVGNAGKFDAGNDWVASSNTTSERQHDRTFELFDGTGFRRLLGNSTHEAVHENSALPAAGQTRLDGLMRQEFVWPIIIAASLPNRWR